MPVPLSIDLRQRVMTAYETHEGSQRQWAKRFKVSLSFIRDLTRHYRQTGAVTPKPHGGGVVATSCPESEVERQKKRSLPPSKRRNA